MNYPLALLAGKVAMLFVVLAASYFLVHVVLVWLLHGDITLREAGRLQVMHGYARISHPYLASLISLSAFYHVYVMLFRYPWSHKVLSGILVSATVLVMANSGWALKLRPHSARLRRVHHVGMLVLLALVIVHRFL
jgi:hypothetical protein